MKVVGIERAIHINTSDVGQFYSLGMRFGVNTQAKYMAFGCEKLSEKERNYLSSLIGVKLMKYDAVVIYLVEKEKK